MKFIAKQQGLSTDTKVKNTIWYSIKYLMYIVMVVWSLSFVAILLWLVMNSLKTGVEYTQDVFSLPKKWDWENYKIVISQIQFKGYSLLGMMGNSLTYIGISIFCALTFPQMAAYALARFDFKGKKLIESVVLISMTIPVVGTLSSTLNFFLTTGLYDTWLGILFMNSSALGFGQIVLTSFYRGMENAYAEAAYMDGASEWVVFLKIYYPQSWPIVFPSLISSIIGAWNDFMTGYLFLPSHPTIALGMQQMQKMFVTFGNDYPLLFAGMVMMLIPIIVIFLRFSKVMLNNKNLGALK